MTSLDKKINSTLDDVVAKDWKLPKKDPSNNGVNAGKRQRAGGGKGKGKNASRVPSPGKGINGRKRVKGAGKNAPALYRVRTSFIGGKGRRQGKGKARTAAKGQGRGSVEAPAAGRRVNKTFGGIGKRRLLPLPKQAQRQQAQRQQRWAAPPSRKGSSKGQLRDPTGARNGKGGGVGRRVNRAFGGIMKRRQQLPQQQRWGPQDKNSPKGSSRSSKGAAKGTRGSLQGFKGKGRGLAIAVAQAVGGKRGNGRDTQKGGGRDTQKGGGNRSWNDGGRNGAGKNSNRQEIYNPYSIQDPRRAAGASKGGSKGGRSSGRAGESNGKWAHDKWDGPADGGRNSWKMDKGKGRSGGKARFNGSANNGNRYRRW